MSQGFSTSMDATNISVASDSVGGTVHGPYRGGLFSGSPGSTLHGLPKAPGVSNLAESTAGLELNPKSTESSPLQQPPSSLPFHHPFIPPQVHIFYLTMNVLIFILLTDDFH